MTCIDLGNFASKIGNAESAQPAYVPAYAVQQLPAEFQSAEEKPQSPFSSVTNNLFSDNLEIQDFDELERILSIAANPELLAAYSEKPAFSEEIAAPKAFSYVEVQQAPLPKLTMSLPHSAQCKKAVCELLFNQYSVESVKFAEQTACQLFSTGRVTGTVLNLGYLANSAVCYTEGYFVSETSRLTQIAGGRRAGTELYEFMQQNGNSALGEGFLQSYYADCIKNFAFGGQKVSFKLPDETALEIDENTFGAVYDCYFNPSSEIAECACGKMLENALAGVGADIKDAISQTTVVSGGMARVTALVNQLMGETKYCITETPENDCFVGLQVLAMLEGGQITKAMFEEKGEALFSTAK